MNSLNPLKITVLMLLGIAGFIDAFLIFTHPAWFNIFVGLLFPITLPFAGAITILFREENEQSRTLSL